MSKRAITVTHQNGEVCTRKSDRPYTHAVVAQISTHRSLQRLAVKMGYAVNEFGLWQGLTDGGTVVRFRSSACLNSLQTRVYLESVCNPNITIAVNTLDWNDCCIKWDHEVVEHTEDEITAMTTQQEANLNTLVNEQIERRIKTARTKIAKIQKEITHVESLGGTTFEVQSWHSRLDLARTASAKYGSGCYTVAIDQNA